MQHVCCFANMLDILWFSIHKVERYSAYFVFDELLFEFLSNDEFKFAKNVERMCADMKMMRPVNAWPTLGRSNVQLRETIYDVLV